MTIHASTGVWRSDEASRKLWQLLVRTDRTFLRSIKLGGQSSFGRRLGKMSLSGLLVTFLGLIVSFALGQRNDGHCPEKFGVQTYPHEGSCDKFYKVS